ncbi:MAG: hypothetical protein A2X86_18310 [Bdellovibrionales bacterium GWA2_49_15]|nr:MAG: hypothetical protein A2X86_18310 [Bdellovibrionales bacterium GWA2_49_15]HAZ11678.1 hypothetical protein [Bdellovibrionales bacterium]
MKLISLVLTLFASQAAFADSWIYQVKEKKLKGVTLSSYRDENALEHYRIGHFVDAKAIEKESVTKSEFLYQTGYGARLVKDLSLAPNDAACTRNLLVTQNNATKICYRLDDNARKDFYEWHDYLEKYILSKEEKDNLILKRHLNKP